MSPHGCHDNILDRLDETFMNCTESFPGALLLVEGVSSAHSDQISRYGRCDNCFQRKPSSQQNICSLRCLQNKLLDLASGSPSVMFIHIQIYRKGCLGNPSNLDRCSRLHTRIISNHHGEFNDCNVISKQNSCLGLGTHDGQGLEFSL